MPAVAHPRASEERYTSWDRARLSVVVPIGVIVAVAIVCIVVAVLSSAQRADEVAVQHEKLLFSRALSTYGERVLREVKSVAASERAIQNIRVKYDPDWVKQRVGLWLKTYFRSRSRLCLRRQRQTGLFAIRPSRARPVLVRGGAARHAVGARLHARPQPGPARRAPPHRSGRARRRPAFASRGDPQPGGPARGHRRGRGRAGRWNPRRARHRGADRHVGEIHRQRGARRHRRATAAHASAQARRRAGAARRLDL